MNSKEEIKELVESELEFLKGKKDKKYENSMDSLLITLECLDGYNFTGEMYFLTISYQNEIVMSMCCFPNNKYKYQFNMLITKYFSKDCPKDISIIMHSYAASLFNNNYILVKPLKIMGEILIRNFPDLWIIKRFGDLIGCSDDIINNHVGIEKNAPIYCIKITEELKEKYRTRDDLKFRYFRVY